MHGIHYRLIRLKHSTTIYSSKYMIDLETACHSPVKQTNNLSDTHGASEFHGKETVHAAWLSDLMNRFLNNFLLSITKILLHFIIIIFVRKIFIMSCSWLLSYLMMVAFWYNLDKLEEVMHHMHGMYTYFLQFSNNYKSWSHWLHSQPSTVVIHLMVM